VSAQTALERGRKDGHNSRSGVFIYIYIYTHTYIFLCKPSYNKLFT
jgi:hypothetical protein